MLSFARDISDYFKMGVNAKVIHRNVGKFAKAWGFGLDFGAIYIENGWKIGLMARDITTTFNAWSHNAELVRDIYAQTQNEIPINSIELTLPRATLSLSRNFELTEEIDLLTVLDLDLTFDGQRNTLYGSDLFNLSPKFGMELGYRQSAFFRVGAGNVQTLIDFDGSKYTSVQPGFGLGFRVSEAVLVDYALTDIGSISETPYSHVFSVKVSLNPLKSGFRLYDGL